MIGYIIGAFLLVIALCVIRYEVKTEKLILLHRDLERKNIKLAYTGGNLLEDYRAVIGILEDHFTKEEIEKMFEEKKKELQKEQEWWND